MQAQERHEQTGPTDHEVLTFQETQEFLRVSHQTLYKLIQQGLPSHKVGRKRMFLRQELMEWVKSK